MRVWHDWEFLEIGNSVYPISVGMVREDGQSLYRVFRNAPWDLIRDHSWLTANVIPYLNRNDVNYMSTSAIKDDVKEFLFDAYSTVASDLELWGWYSAYDHVCLGQLFGKMMDLPEWCPTYTNDLKQEFMRVGSPTYPRQQTGLHNALEDAKYLREKHLWLDSLGS